MKGDVALVTGKPEALVGGVDNHNNPDWLFLTPTKCDGQTLTDADYDEPRAPAEATLTTKRSLDAGFTAKLKAELKKEISQYVEADLDAGVEYAVKEVTNLQVKLKPFIYSLNNDAYNRLKSACQKPEESRYVRKQALVLQISGESETDLATRLEAALEAKLQPGAAAAEAPVDGKVELKAHYKSAVEKALKTTIHQNYYMLAASYEP